MGMGDTRDRLGDLLPSALCCEGATRPEAVDRDDDQAGTEPDQLLQAEAALAQSSRAVAIDEHVGLARQCGEALGIFSTPEVEEAAALAMAQVPDELGYLRKV